MLPPFGSFLLHYDNPSLTTHVGTKLPSPMWRRNGWSIKGWGRWWSLSPSPLFLWLENLFFLNWITLLCTRNTQSTMLCWVAQLCPTLYEPMDCSSPASSVHGDSPGKNTGVGCLFLHQGNFPAPGIKPGSPALQADSLPSESPC